MCPCRWTERRPSGRAHTRHGEERKQQLLDAAAALFAQHGYGATRIADICREAGVAKGLFYWYFPTKAELFTELVRVMRRRLRRAQAEAMDPAAGAARPDRGGTEASVRFMAANAAYFALLEVERTDPEFADVFSEGSGVYLDDVRRLVVSGQARRHDHRRRPAPPVDRRARRGVVVLQLVPQRQPRPRR